MGLKGRDASLAPDPYMDFHGAPGAWQKMRDVTDPLHPKVVWHVCPPCGHPGQLVSKEEDPSLGGHHKVIENEDGTITVEPSIICTVEGCGWHGFLQRGVWSSV